MWNFVSDMKICVPVLMNVTGDLKHLRIVVRLSTHFMYIYVFYNN